MREFTLQLHVLRMASLGLGGLAILLLIYIIAGTASKASGRLGLRGLKRQKVLEDNEGWRQIEPFVRWLGVRVSGLVSDDIRDKLDTQIGLAGDFLGLTADEFVALSILSGIGGLGAGWLFGAIGGVGNLAVIPFGLVATALPYLQVTGAAQERLKDIGRGLPYVIDLMAMAMSAGLDFPGAVRQVIDKSSNPNDPLVEEFTLILQTLQLGRTRKDALQEFARRVPNETVIEFVGAVVQAEDRGNPVAEVLLIQATSSRQRRTVRAEEVAAQAGVKLVGPLMLVFGCIMGLILAPALMNISGGI
jgi:tight adherence protein C